ncbi:MAG TPA: hypothetical protein VK097_13535 [Lentibacillus sp.]|nr:hypothetical protein [Lentibacillus sp.]HLR63431.1 hypothetical protein [Lentibacillus sp.]
MTRILTTISRTVGISTGLIFTAIFFTSVCVITVMRIIATRLFLFDDFGGMR